MRKAIHFKELDVTPQGSTTPRGRTQPPPAEIDYPPLNDQVAQEVQDGDYPGAKGEDCPQMGFLMEDLRFWRFHTEHPHVYCYLRALARLWLGRGYSRVGIKTLVEVARWTISMETDGEFKINNDYTARYSRLLMLSEPELEGMFVTREIW